MGFHLARLHVECPTLTGFNSLLPSFPYTTIQHGAPIHISADSAASPCKGCLIATGQTKLHRAVQFTSQKRTINPIKEISRKQEAGSRKQEAGSRKQEAGSRKQEAG
ncbi:hypothetical protein CK911_04255 [Aeromonas sp. CU5]|nr:hypothetical protein CK911_04255 [Aeromonas sp. CU5]